MIVVLRWSEIPVSLKQSLKFVSKRSVQFGFFEFSKQVGLILKEESANVSKRRKCKRIQIGYVAIRLAYSQSY